MIPALGVDEPYASAIVHGLKRWETRGQPPNGEMRPDGGLSSLKPEQFL